VTLPTTATLAEAQAWLRDRLDEGADCPCCKQRARVYERPLTSVAARAVIALWRTCGRQFGHLPTIGREHLADVQGQGGYLNLGQHWGLIESERAIRGPEGRAGYWRVTPLGEAFVNDRTTVPGRARLYDGRCLALTGDRVCVVDVLGTQFRLADLLGPVALDEPATLFDLGAAA
jgi:hypothetical protein